VHGAAAVGFRASPRAADHPDFAAEFSTWAAALTVASLPHEALVAARLNLLDTLACATAGCTAPGAMEVIDLVRSWGGAPQAALWGGTDRVPAPHAAWANGVMAHARDYDDTHDAAILHAGVSVIPSAIAAAELRGGCSGAELIAGIAVGLELVCRLGVATTIGIIESGFIYSSLFGYFGAAAAAARVLGFTAEQMQNTIGIAYSQAAGTHQVTRDGALTKRMQPGLAARAAIVAAELTRRNVRGAQDVFEGEDGLFRTYLRSRYDPGILRDGLGRRFHFVDLSYKPYPSCRFNHTAIDAALALRACPGFDIARIRRIRIGVNNQAYQAVCTPPDIRARPRTIVQAQFSIPYNVACALVRGQVLLGDFTDAALGDADILALSSTIECFVDPEIERDWGRSISPTRIVIDTVDGVLESRIDTPPGHPTAPMTADASDRKLRDCLAFGGVAWPGDMAARLSSMTATIEQLPDARNLVRLLTPATMV
jgi:2-methylcitrate dehydratase PrpD